MHASTAEQTSVRAQVAAPNSLQVIDQQKMMEPAQEGRAWEGSAARRSFDLVLVRTRGQTFLRSEAAEGVGGMYWTSEETYSPYVTALVRMVSERLPEAENAEETR